MDSGGVGLSRCGCAQAGMHAARATWHSFSHRRRAWSSSSLSAAAAPLSDHPTTPSRHHAVALPDTTLRRSTFVCFTPTRHPARPTALQLTAPVLSSLAPSFSCTGLPTPDSSYSHHVSRRRPHRLLRRGNPAHRGAHQRRRRRCKGRPCRG